MLALALAAWGLMTWPLARYARQGIPASAHGEAGPPARYMVAGDHLQLLYRFELVRDMLAGGTPWLQNPYEFQYPGHDKRVGAGAFYLPFSLPHAVLAAVAGPAAGWNLTGLLSLWLTGLFTALLLRPYTRSDWQAALGALPALLLPFRYDALLGGSPAGFAMLWPPVVLYGVDVLVRRRVPAGGLAVGAGVLGAALTDAQILFFTVLAAPVYSAFVCWHARAWAGWTRRDWRRLCLGGVPAAAGAGAALWHLLGLHARISGSAHMAGGRDLHEVLLFAPRISDLLHWGAASTTTQTVYIGFAVLALMALGLLAGAGTCWRQRRVDPGGAAAARRRVWALAVIVTGVAVVAVLALGPRGPFEALLFRAARRLVPPYRMIRQSSKVFCLLPTLLALGTGLAVSLLAPGSRGWRARLAAICLGVLAVFGAAEYRLQVRPLICLLADGQAAYREVAAESNGNGRLAMALPLWPGDTHWSSLYAYYGLRHHLRLVNGYSPVVDAAYMTGIFERFRALNLGEARDEDLDALLDMGVRDLLLHEDAFPEKVSPFPVGTTLQRLLAHPRLLLRRQANRVWAFRILRQRRLLPPAGPAWPLAFPSRHFEFEHGWPADAVERRADPACSGGAFVRLEQTGMRAGCRRTSLPGAGDAFWLLRVRGSGRAVLRLWDDAGQATEAEALEHAGADWTWRTLALAADGPAVARPEFELEQGALDLDTMLLVARPGGADVPVIPLGTGGGAVRLPAPMFFHAGYTDLAADAVVLDPAWEPAGVVFYGPRLPLAPGRWRARMRFEAAAPAGTVLGEWQAGPNSAGGATVRAGKPAVLELDAADGLPVICRFTYAATAPVRIQAVEFEPVVGP